MQIPFCRPLPPSWWGRIKSLFWRILAAVLGLIATTWIARQAWFSDLFANIPTLTF
jgi:hypothetical protein